jgi:hypothetical protein
VEATEPLEASTRLNYGLVGLAGLQSIPFLILLRQFLCSLMLITFADDLVAVENASHLLIADRHRYARGNASAHHIANSSAYQDFARVPRKSLTGRPLRE